MPGASERKICWLMDCGRSCWLPLHRDLNVQAKEVPPCHICWLPWTGGWRHVRYFIQSRFPPWLLGATLSTWMRRSYGWQSSPTWFLSSLTPLARLESVGLSVLQSLICRLCARELSILWKRSLRSTPSGCASISAKLTRLATSLTGRGLWCKLFR